MKNLKIFGVQELDAIEMSSIDGGLFLGRFGALRKVVEWIGIADMAEDFVGGTREGWESHRN